MLTFFFFMANERLLWSTTCLGEICRSYQEPPPSWNQVKKPLTSEYRHLVAICQCLPPSCYLRHCWNHLRSVFWESSISAEFNISPLPSPKLFSRLWTAQRKRFSERIFQVRQRHLRRRYTNRYGQVRFLF